MANPGDVTIDQGQQGQQGQGGGDMYSTLVQYGKQRYPDATDQEIQDGAKQLVDSLNQAGYSHLPPQNVIPLVDHVLSRMESQDPNVQKQNQLAHQSYLVGLSNNNNDQGAAAANTFKTMQQVPAVAADQQSFGKPIMDAHQQFLDSQGQQNKVGQGLGNLMDQFKQQSDEGYKQYDQKLQAMTPARGVSSILAGVGSAFNPNAMQQNQDFWKNEEGKAKELTVGAHAAGIESAFKGMQAMQTYSDMQDKFSRLGMDQESHDMQMKKEDMQNKILGTTMADALRNDKVKTDAFDPNSNFSKIATAGFMQAFGGVNPVTGKPYLPQQMLDLVKNGANATELQAMAGALTNLDQHGMAMRDQFIKFMGVNAKAQLDQAEAGKTTQEAKQVAPNAQVQRAKTQEETKVIAPNAQAQQNLQKAEAVKSNVEAGVSPTSPGTGQGNAPLLPPGTQTTIPPARADEASKQVQSASKPLADAQNVVNRMSTAMTQLNQMEKLLGELPSGNLAKVGAEKYALISPTQRAYNQLQRQLGAMNLKSIYGSRPTNIDVQQWSKTSDLQNLSPDEQKMRLSTLRNQIQTDIDAARKEAGTLGAVSNRAAGMSGLPQTQGQPQPNSQENWFDKFKVKRPQ